MAEYELYCFGESGNCFKVAMMLALSGAEWAVRPVDYFKGETRTEAYRRDVNEMGEAPVLVHGERRLSQSGAILHYLADRLGTFGWTDGDEHHEVLRWLLFDNHKFTSYLGTVRFLTHFLKKDDEVVEFLKARRDTALAVAEKRLTGRDWVALDRPTIADLSLAGYVFYDDELDFAFSDYPALDAWRTRIRNLEGWQGPYDLMPRAK